MIEPFSENLQVNLLVLLCFDSEHFSTIRHMTTPDRFDRDYQPLVHEAFRYIDKYQTPPKEHIDELLEQQLKGEHRKFYTQLLRTLYDLSDSGINKEYVVSCLNVFLNYQTFRDKLMELSPILKKTNPTEEDVSTLYDAMSELTKQRQTTMDTGTWGADTQRLTDTGRDPADGFKTGIKELDKLGIGPWRKELLFLIGVAGRGKSWWLVHLGKTALVKGKKVCHITLEMSESLVHHRYVQSYFAAAKREMETVVANIEVDEDGMIEHFGTRKYKPKFTMNRPEDFEAITKKIKAYKKRFNRLNIKEFASGTLTVGELEAYLDMLERTQNFVPDILMIDYVDLMKLNRDNYRTSLGGIFVDIRGLAKKRNIAIVTVTQSNRQGVKAKEITEDLVSEDWSKIQTADTILSYTQSPHEAAYKLARISVLKARTDQSGQRILISQNYDTGQFCIRSAEFKSSYEQMLKGTNKE